MKRFVSILLCVLMLTGMMSLIAGATGKTESITVDGITVSVSNVISKETKTVKIQTYDYDTYQPNGYVEKTFTVCKIPATGAKVTVKIDNDNFAYPGEMGYVYDSETGNYGGGEGHAGQMIGEVSKGYPGSWELERSEWDGEHDFFAVGDVQRDIQIWVTYGSLVGTDPVPADGNPFTNVKKTDYFYDAVLWALKNNVTTGTSATTFSPADTCTRGQVVTFLWRAKGCPEPKTTVNPFTDVKESDYYYKAVLWAVENGITNGTSATEFAPKNTCTNAHVVTFLHRAEGTPASKGESELAAAYPENACTAIPWHGPTPPSCSPAPAAPSWPPTTPPAPTS